ncbi:MAG: hypothetical protein AAF085_12495 [Planctomycetota bacterium]
MSTLQAPKELTYEPVEHVPATMHQQRNKSLKSGNRVECPVCGAVFAPGAVVTTRDPEWDIDLGCMVGQRGIYCAGCHHVMQWREVFFNGKPTGEVIGGPGFSSGDDYIRRFLSAHPEAQEVEQV